MIINTQNPIISIHLLLVCITLKKSWFLSLLKHPYRNIPSGGFFPVVMKRVIIILVDHVLLSSATDSSKDGVWEISEESCENSISIASSEMSCKPS